MSSNDVDFHRLPVEFTAALERQLEEALVTIGAWESEHLNIGDYRINDLTQGLRLASKAARHLRDGVNYPEQIAARKGLLAKLGYADAVEEDSHRFLAQVKDVHADEWRTLRGGQQGYETAWDGLSEPMQRHGLRYGEIAGHIADMLAGHILSAEDGTEFRVVKNGE